MRMNLAVIPAMLACVSAVSAVNIETVRVGDLGNAGELSGAGAGGSGPDRICGAVNYNYRIGKYEVTAGQYCGFLNAVAKTDTYELYNTNMWSYDTGCKIQRIGTSGDYTYAVAPEWANRPVNWVSWGDAARFANWLHNGQPTGAQDTSTTEDGAYYLNGARGNWDVLVNRKDDWKWAVTSEDEWYKAAYYDPNYGGVGVPGYWFYPTQSNTAPGRDMADASGNNANYYISGGGPYPIDSGRWFTVGGQFQNSASVYGAFDQAGNVWELTEPAIRHPICFIRGGSYQTGNDALRSWRRSYVDTGHLGESDSIGFRVAYIPEPATAVLLVSGGLALVRRRSRRWQ